MVDIRQAMQSKFLTVDTVTESKTRKVVVISPGGYEKTEYGEKLTMEVNLDGMHKIWRPNRETCQNLSQIGGDTVHWVGKVIDLTIESRNGRPTVIGKPGNGKAPKEKKKE